MLDCVVFNVYFYTLVCNELFILLYKLIFCSLGGSRVVGMLVVYKIQS